MHWVDTTELGLALQAILPRPRSWTGLIARHTLFLELLSYSIMLHSHYRELCDEHYNAKGEYLLCN
mgnify:CR=1